MDKAELVSSWGMNRWLHLVALMVHRCHLRPGTQRMSAQSSFCIFLVHLLPCRNRGTQWTPVSHNLTGGQETSSALGEHQICFLVRRRIQMAAFGDTYCYNHCLIFWWSHQFNYWLYFSKCSHLSLSHSAEVFISWGLKRFRGGVGSVIRSDWGAVYLLTFHFGNQTAIPSTQGGPWNLSLLILSLRQGGWGLSKLFQGQYHDCSHHRSSLVRCGKWGRVKIGKWRGDGREVGVKNICRRKSSGLSRMR